MFCDRCPETARRARQMAARSVLLFLLFCALSVGYGLLRWGQELSERIRLLEENNRLQSAVAKGASLYRGLAERNMLVCQHALRSVAYRLGLDLDQESLPVVYANASEKGGGVGGPGPKGKRRARR